MSGANPSEQHADIQMRLLVPGDPVSDPELVERLRSNNGPGCLFPLGPFSRRDDHFIASLNDREAAYLLLCTHREQSLLDVHEAWVSCWARRRGLCRWLIDFAKQQGRREGVDRLILRPCPLDDSVTESTLRSVYASCGFVNAREDGVMEFYLDRQE